MKHSHLPALVLAVLASRATAAPQSNVVPGLDVRLSRMNGIEALGRTGVFPDGLNGVALETTVCNEGTVEVPWFQPMNLDHPTIGFLVAAVRDGRIEQISDRSHVKHGFFAANGIGCQTTCVRPGGFGEYLGIGCSDTYAVTNNGDNFYLGHPDEIDPWLGTWDRVCSVFDRGIPAVPAPEDCDGRRSLTHSMALALGPVGNRVRVSDADLIAGGELFFQGHYVVEGVAEDLRDDCVGSRPFTASWNGTRWELLPSGPLALGSILGRWPGATVTSATNGADDGRVFAAVLVTGPVDGFYRYEYALHDRDNARGVGALRIPKCPGARVRELRFRDVDGDASNDWTATVLPGAIRFETSSSPLRWNTIFNFSFESDAAPADGMLGLAAFDPGPGAPVFEVAGQAPLALHTVRLGPGCALDEPPTLFATGGPPRATLGNASFAIGSAGNRPLEPHLLFVGAGTGSCTFRGCTLWTGASPARVWLASARVSDAVGRAVHPAPIPNDPALEGFAFRLQALGRDPGNGALFTDLELSEGLLVRVGNAISGCP
jgi:hypothetical protein